MAVKTDRPELPLDPAQFIDQLPLKVSLIDLDGRLVFYSDSGSNLLDRRPELIEQDVRDCHAEAASSERTTRILEAYKNGGRQEYVWRVERDGVRFAVRVGPWVEQGRVLGLIHAAMVINGPLEPDRERE